MLKKWQWFGAACLFAILLFFATDKLTETPPTWFDEGMYLQAAMNDSLHGKQELQLSPTEFLSTAYVTGGFPFLKPISWSFRFFGIGLLQARIVMVGFMMLAAAMFFMLIKRLFGWNAALLSLALLVTFPPLYGQGKNALGEVPGLMYLGVFLLSVAVLEKRKFEGLWWYVLAGLAAGLCVATKPIFFLLGGAVLIAALLKRRSIEWRWNYIGLAMIAFFLPFAYWFAHQFFGSESPASVLSFYGNPYSIQDLNHQMLANALIFVRDASPAYFLILMLVWTSSIAVRVYKKTPITIAETTAFAFSVLVWLAYLRTAGWYRYYFPAEVVALVFVPYATYTLAQQFAPRNIANAVAPVFVAVLLVVQCYQLLFTSWVATHSARTTTHRLNSFFASMPRESTFLIYNRPSLPIFLPNQNYYQYLEAGPGHTFGSTDILSVNVAEPEYLVVADTDWENASTTAMSGFSEVANIDGTIIAKHR